MFVLVVTRSVRVESPLFSVSVFGPVVCSSLVSGAWSLLSGSGSKTQLVSVARLGLFIVNLVWVSVWFVVVSCVLALTIVNCSRLLTFGFLLLRLVLLHVYGVLGAKKLLSLARKVVVTRPPRHWSPG